MFHKKLVLVKEKMDWIEFDNLRYWWWLILNKKIGVCCSFFEWNGDGI